MPLKKHSPKNHAYVHGRQVIKINNSKSPSRIRIKVKASDSAYSFLAESVATEPLKVGIRWQSVGTASRKRKAGNIANNVTLTKYLIGWKIEPNTYVN